MESSRSLAKGAVILSVLVLAVGMASATQLRNIESITPLSGQEITIQGNVSLNNNHWIKGVRDPTSSSDLITKTFADSTYLNRDSQDTMQANIDMNGNDLIGVRRIDGSSGNHRIRFDSSSSWIEFVDQANNRQDIVTQDTYINEDGFWLGNEDLVNIGAGSGLGGGGTSGLTDQVSVNVNSGYGINLTSDKVMVDFGYASDLDADGDISSFDNANDLDSSGNIADFSAANDLDSNGNLVSGSVADNEISDNTVDNSEIQNGDSFTFGGITSTGNVSIGDPDTTINSYGGAETGVDIGLRGSDNVIDFEHYTNPGKDFLRIKYNSGNGNVEIPNGNLDMKSQGNINNVNVIDGSSDVTLRFDQSNSWIEVEDAGSSTREDIVVGRIYLNDNVGWFDGSGDQIQDNTIDDSEIQADASITDLNTLGANSLQDGDGGNRIEVNSNLDMNVNRLVDANATSGFQVPVGTDKWS